MLRLILVVLGIAAKLGEALSQIPLIGDDTASSSSSSDEASVSPWRLNFSSTAPYLFSSTSSLLQQWGNTFFPNGHSVVACEISPFTLFYHGRMDAETPPSPEWLAFDIEMAYGIMGSSPNSHMLTYQTTRPVKALYFDGESAALMGLGQLDTQMLHVFGNVSGPEQSGGFRGLYDEYARAHGLCDWLLEKGLRGDGWGYEGVIRMNAAFEMIWCNFTSPSLKLLTHLNVTAPLMPDLDESDSNVEIDVQKEEGGMNGFTNKQETSYYPLPPTPTRTDSSTDPTRPPQPPNWRGGQDTLREPFLKFQTWGWFSSATYHYGSSKNGPGLGETRARAYGCGIASYYSPRYANLASLRAEDERASFNLTAEGFWKGEGPSGNRTLALRDLLRRRRYHHLENATTEEAALMRSASERALRQILEGGSSTSSPCSGTDWVQMTNEITRITATHLQELAAALSRFPRGDARQQQQRDASSSSAVRDWMVDVRAQSHSFLVGYLEYPVRTADPSLWRTDSDLFRTTHARCRYRYTRLMAPAADEEDEDGGEEGSGVLLSPEERDLRWAVEETFGAVCSVLLTVGFGIERSWAAHFQKSGSGGSRPETASELGALAATWSEGLEELMAWLGWADQFVGCSEVCAWDERCYIPMWPLIGWPRGGGGGGGRGPPRGPPSAPGNGSHPGGDFDPPPHHGGGGPHHPPDHPDGNHPGGGQPPRNRRPSWGFFGEDDLWEPKCINASFFVHDF
ncbi:hypothetical protein F5X96DRAFT_671686 [Biscogniauxia mediterranea]|nr:hypothetical protein F5X96DRAFT_671686 [Biscogniauxia mediterranea]